MQIGEVAQRTGLSQRTLRYYEEIGLVVPSARTAGGFRVYAEQDLERLLFIKRMKPLDFSLEETRDLMDVLDALAEGPAGPERAALVKRLGAWDAAARSRVDAVREQLVIAEEFAAGLGRAMRAHRAT